MTFRYVNIKRLNALGDAYVRRSRHYVYIGFAFLHLEIISIIVQIFCNSPFWVAYLTWLFCVIGCALAMYYHRKHLNRFRKFGARMLRISEEEYNRRLDERKNSR